MTAINWDMAKFVFSVVSWLILGFMGYAYMNASSSSKMQTLERDVQELRKDLRDLERREP